MTTNNTDDDLINRLTGEYSVGVNKEFGTRKFFVPPIAIEAADKIKELQERLDCINELLTSAFNYGQSCKDGLDAAIAEYDAQGVNQAHRIAAGGELPKRVKE